MNDKRVRTIVALLTVTLVVSLLLVFSMVALGAPLPQNVVGESPFVQTKLATTTIVTGTTPSPASIAGRNVTLVGDYASAVAFITADVGLTPTLTIAAQSSADGINWAAASARYYNGSGAPIDTAVSVTITADGVYALKVPQVNGLYLRYLITTDQPAVVEIKEVLRK